MKNYIKKGILYLIASLIFLSTNNALSLEKESHKFLNKAIANQAWLNNYLNSNLGFTKGVEEVFKGKQVLQWIADGGVYEDVPILRTVNHFHNPLKPWNEAGLNDSFIGTSSVIWAQDQSSAGLLGGDWSWKRAREYFYSALTGADKATRDKYFGNTFRAVGQLMHLVQDASVPAHVRNDRHLVAEVYEEWVLKNPELLNLPPNPFISSILNESPNPLAPIPIAKIFDTDKYNSGISPSTSIAWGISEYTNSNFVSHDTIFTENYDPSHKHYFPYPKYSPGNYEKFEVDHSPDKKRIYFKKKGDGEAIEHFVTAGPLHKYLSFDPALQRNELKLDGECHKDYAEKLIPRAVGYSAGLLNYFFRGQLGVKLVDSEKIKIINYSTENMNGTFALFYEATDGNRKPVPGGAWSLSLAAGQESNILTFNEPTDMDESGQGILVFRGELGKESDAVVGKICLIVKKYHWTIVVDCPPHDSYRYSTRYEGLAQNDCGTSVGWEMLVTRTDNCPNEGVIKIYLLASDQFLANVYFDRKCNGNIKSRYVGQFGKKEFLKKETNYQTRTQEETVRQLYDAQNISNCPLGNGETAYMIDLNTIFERGPLIPILWAMISVDSPEIVSIKNQLYPQNTLFAAFIPTNFNEVGFGRNYPNEGVFTYATTGWVDFFLYTPCNRTETTTCCYFDHHIEEPMSCFPVVRTIPGFLSTHKGLKITIPDIGYEFDPL